jgi:beta-phosphoglucomutase-like phosphatase (HAD superfamily)
METFMIDIHPEARGLIFDIDGTLADTMTIHLTAWKMVARSHGFEYPDELFYGLAGTPTRKIVPIVNDRFGLNLDVESTVREKEQAFLDRIDQVRPIGPVADVVRRCHGRVPMSLGTGGTRELARLTMKTIGMDQYFDAMVTAEDVEHHKPAPDTFLECARLMGVEPRYCQVFEDANQGLEAARRAGMIATDVRPYLA